MRKRVLILLLLGATACSPEQSQAWLDWFDRDPEGAASWAIHECGDLCTLDWDRDGLVEPEPSADSSADVESSDDSENWSDETITPTEAEDQGVGVYWPWDELAQCESGGDWHISTGNGYYGGLQFALGSWQAAGGSGYPHEHTAAEQIHRGEILQDMQGWNAWPTCARIVGLL